MAKFVFAQAFFLIVVSLTSTTCSPTYWTRREAILKAENSMVLGGRLSFENGERIVNDIVMAAKRDEIQKDYADAAKFAPSRNFLDTKGDIENSEVYRIIRKMPKGAVLHVHDTAIASEEFMLNNVTHRENLYACESGEKIGDKLSLRFFDVPNEDCDWKLLSELRLRSDVGTIDERIRRQMSMNDSTLSKRFYNGNEAWTKFNSIFIFIGSFLTYRPVYEDLYYQGLRELYDDNVIYLELRSTLPTLYDLDGKEYGCVQVAQIYKSITDRFVSDNPGFIGAKLIYAPVKTSDSNEIDKYLSVAAELKRVLPDFFAGFDLVGYEDKLPPLSDWVNKINEIDGKLKFFFHAGETNWNGLQTDKNLLDAVLLNAQRIGHGYALTKHPKVLEIVKEKKIAIEICPISNQVLALVKDLRNHPASSLFVDDVPVVVSNDDPGLWGSHGLSYDFYEAFMGIMPLHADIRAIKQLAINSLIYSSMNDVQKCRALSIWQKQWNAFLETFLNESKVVKQY